MTLGNALNLLDQVVFQSLTFVTQLDQYAVPQLVQLKIAGEPDAGISGDALGLVHRGAGLGVD